MKSRGRCGDGGFSGRLSDIGPDRHAHQQHGRQRAHQRAARKIGGLPGSLLRREIGCVWNAGQGLPDMGGFDLPGIFGISRLKGKVGQQIDALRASFRGLGEQIKCLVIKKCFSLPTGSLQAVVDIGGRVVARKRSQLETVDDAILHLPQAGVGKKCVQPGLAEEQDIGEFVLFRFQIGQHADFFE